MTTATADDMAANRRGLKVHLRVVAVGGSTYRVVSLRSATGARFSTNYFHDTWHIVTGGAGAAVLGRLLWGLAFQRQPGTLVLIDAPHLVTTPFEGDRPDPIVIVPAGLTRFDADHLRAVRRRLQAGAASTTIRWHTFGLPAGLDALADRPGHRQAELRAGRAREQMHRRAGMICLTAPPAILRDHGAGIYAMRRATSECYHPLAEGPWWRRWAPQGEVQVFPRFDDDVAAAAVARRELLGDDARPLTDAVERAAVWARRTQVQDRRRAARGPRP